MPSTFSYLGSFYSVGDVSLVLLCILSSFLFFFREWLIHGDIGLVSPFLWMEYAPFPPVIMVPGGRSYLVGVFFDVVLL